MPPRNRPHIVVPWAPKTERYTPRPRAFKPQRPPAVEDRAGHAARLIDALRGAQREAAARRAAARPIAVAGVRGGFYVEFESIPAFELKLDALGNKPKRIEVVAVTEVRDGVVARQRATVFVPEGQLGHFEKRLEEYATRDTKGGQPRHADLVERISALRLATIEALWTDEPEVFPRTGERIWWEVWLRRGEDGGETARFEEFSRETGIEVRNQRLAFPERVVTLAAATVGQLAASIDVIDSVAELRRAKEEPAFFEGLRPVEQAEWVDDLRQRTVEPVVDAPAVCVLDTGVNRAHPLLAPGLAPRDMHACLVTWGTADHDSHGTEMAGLAQYGDLGSVLADRLPVRLEHRLESVKILPPVGANPPELYGTRTAEATSRVEIQAPGRPRCFSMSISARDGRDRGKPTSWSSAVDALAAGRSFNATTSGLEYLDEGEAPIRRLFVICAGNMRVVDPAVSHLDASDAESVHDPGQAWNAVTVGASTDLATIDGDDASFAGWRALASPGELSPHSTTSLPFDRQWPIKPDVVYEGGNVAVSPEATQATAGVASLSVLTTYWQPAQRLLTTSNATSAATAQVAHIAGVILASRPDAWPETVRALLVHSAEWTAPMVARLDAAGPFRRREILLRRYGHGVPDAERAIRSAANALTLIVQTEIKPFQNGAMREMHLHELPWPQGVLAELGDTPVRMRVTLSYFVEPNPARLGWKGRHRYASHSLRFDVKRAEEGAAAFRRRLNRRAETEEGGELPGAPGPDAGWYLGDQTRTKGSLHQDTWMGTAADLAARGVIGVFPVSGWWKEQPKLDRSEAGARYALVVSITTDREDVDIWTPVAVQVGVPVVIS